MKLLPFKTPTTFITFDPAKIGNYFGFASIKGVYFRKNKAR